MYTKKLTLYFLTALFFVLGCKNESKTAPETQAETVVLPVEEPEHKLDKSVIEMWNNFIESNTEYDKDELPDSWFFHDNKEDADRLGQLTLSGKKTATTSGLYAWYEEVNADLPKIGTKNIVTDFNGKALGILETIEVDTIPFNQMTAGDASMDMGTKIEPLKKWKKAHWDFFTSIMKENGERPTEDMLVVFERFKIVWPRKPQIGD